MNARYYNPNTGRFLSQDSYKGSAYEPWTQQLYTYCGNNPINMIDPTGHRPMLMMTDSGGKKKPVTVISKEDQEKYDRYRQNLSDIEDVIDENYEDQYFDLIPNAWINFGIDNFTNGPTLSEEELDLAGAHPFAAIRGFNNRNIARDMEAYIMEKHGMPELVGGTAKFSNAFLHTYLVVINRCTIGGDLASKFANAHEN